jgi:hypothetical protein
MFSIFSSKKCRVDGCKECAPGKSHFCTKCGLKDSTHCARDCNMIIDIKCCRVFGCTSCKSGKTHFCDIYKDKDSTHRARDNYKTHCFRNDLT